MVGRAKCAGIAVIDWLVLAIILQTVHSTSPDGPIEARLPLRNVSATAWCFGFHEEIWCGGSMAVTCGHNPSY
ncbi:hypothetical protein MY3296_006325 [Beauveria thailandica]